MSYTTAETDQAFVVPEVTPGTLVAPSGTGILKILNTLNWEQNKNLFPSEEREQSWDRTSYLSGRYNPGTASMTHYMKRSGDVDTEVTAYATMLKCALGRRTANAGTNINYQLLRYGTDTDMSFSTFYRKGPMTFQIAGCLIDEYTWPVIPSTGQDSMFRGTATMRAFRGYRIGRTVLAEALATTDAGLDVFNVAPADLAPFDHATDAQVAGKFMVGGYVMVGALTTAHLITDINPTTGDVTVTPAFASDQAIGSVVQGYMPTASEVASQPIASHKGFFVYNGANFIITGGTIHLVNNRQVLVDEKNDSDYPTSDLRVGRRIVTLEGVTAHFDADGLVKSDKFWSIADRVQQYSAAIHIGNELGYIWDFNFQGVIAMNPNIVGDEINDLNIGFEALASSSLNDSFNLESR